MKMIPFDDDSGECGLPRNPERPDDGEREKGVQAQARGLCERSIRVEGHRQRGHCGGDDGDDGIIAIAWSYEYPAGLIPSSIGISGLSQECDGFTMTM